MRKRLEKLYDAVETSETLLVYTTQESGRWNGCRFEGSCDWEDAAG